jgi:hypothetical protein
VSDIQAGTNRVAIQAATGQTYGEAGKQIAAQRAVPMGAPPTEATGQPQMRRPMPGSLGDLTRPTERPDEPITAGADFGAGPSSLQAGILPAPSASNDVLEQLLYLNRLYPNPDVENLISVIRDGGV